MQKCCSNTIRSPSLFISHHSPLLMIDFFRRGARPASSSGLIPFIIHSDVIVVAGSHFNRHQHSHATSCRHFHIGPQAQIPVDFPMPHPGQSQTGMSHHLGPAHQPAGALHPALNHIPAPPFQDIPAPPFLPQALHQQYLIQQQILEAQHRRILPQSRYDGVFNS